MNTNLKTRVGRPLRCLLAALVTVALPPGVAAQTLNFATSPLFLGTSVKPNVLVVYDNSQSMDGTMSCKLIAGDDVLTRGNIARSVLRSTITSYRSQFQWGLASFGLSGNKLYTTYPYYFGTDAQVVYTNDCIAGISASNGNLRCIANPQNGNGFNFITYAVSGDDPSINDVLYTGDIGNQAYGIGVNGTTTYNVFRGRDATSGWALGNFNNGYVTRLLASMPGATTPTSPAPVWSTRPWRPMPSRTTTT